MDNDVAIPIAMVAIQDGPESTIRNHRRLPEFRDAFITVGRLVLCRPKTYRQIKAEHLARRVAQREKSA